MRLALIGVGLIGGSFAMALRAAGKVRHIVGFDMDPAVMQQAIGLGVIDSHATSSREAVRGAEVVMLASPVGAMPHLLSEITSDLDPDAIVTDVGSVKASVVDAARAALGAKFARFVPAHPIAGSELSGVAHSDAELFRRKVCVVTPVEDTDPDALRTIETLWRAIGSETVHMSADEHDGMYAAVSHMPHLLSFALVAYIAAAPDAKRRLALAGSGFRDFARMAASNAVMWRDICLANRSAISQELGGYRVALGQLHEAVEHGDGEALHRVFSQPNSK